MEMVTFRFLTWDRKDVCVLRFRAHLSVTPLPSSASLQGDRGSHEMRRPDGIVSTGNLPEKEETPPPPPGAAAKAEQFSGWPLLETLPWTPGQHASPAPAPPTRLPTSRCPPEPEASTTS